MSASAVMCISLLELKHCTALRCLVHLASLHCLVKIHKMSVKFRAIHACEFDLIAYLKTARAAHPGPVYHDRIHADNSRNPQLLSQQTDKLHHDHRTDRNADIVFISIVYKLFYHCGDHAGMVTAMVEELVNNGNKYDVCVAIGPMIMMKFVCLLTKKLGIPTIVSMNPIMVDGTGMCGACRLQVGDEIKFACVDGPEFDGHLVDFDQAMKRSQMYKTAEGRAMLKLQEGDTHHGGCGHCGGDE